MTEINGDWFSPKNPTTKLPGTLTIDDGAMELQLYTETDFLGQPLYDNENEISQYSIILGETWQGKITLVNCDLVAKNKIGKKFATFSISPKLMFEGEHFASTNDINATAISCSYTYLSAWMEDLTHESPFKNITGQLSDLDPRLNKELVIDIENGFSVHIHQFLREHDITKRTRVSHQIHHSVDFVSKTNRPFVEFEEKAIAFQKLMELALDCSITIQWSMMKCGLKNQTTVFITKASSRNRVSKDSDSHRSPSSMLFSYYKLGEHGFKNAINKWFASYTQFSTVYDIYLDTNKRYNETGILLTSIMFNNRVLNIIQGLEQYHRLSNPQDDETKDAFKESLKPILAKLDSKEKDWLKARAFRKTTRLEDRLVRLLEVYATSFTGIFDAPSEKLDFAKHLAEIRNSLSHGRNEKSDIGAENQDAYIKARILLLVCILDSIGINPETSCKLIERCHRYGSPLEFYRKSNAK
ncbi:ApeA N-terminal domain 1-containing protein [Dawidia soli]|uniref:ApeA N-terminal domain-containing protein n=1 Tax=Dawidia soli TaxID=2782352 RepID=A0AAP2DBB1_9BACT|nr:HEPN domain-containing protein [Dawidia soli]MBT1688861.1 hypothetical protein [Dawidia soli]